MRYFDEEDVIAEYEKQLQKKDNELERLNNIINKAIEYIENEETNNNSNWICRGREDLLDILKGK